MNERETLAKAKRKERRRKIYEHFKDVYLSARVPNSFSREFVRETFDCAVSVFERERAELAAEFREFAVWKNVLESRAKSIAARRRHERGTNKNHVEKQRRAVAERRERVFRYFKTLNERGESPPFERLRDATDYFGVCYNTLLSDCRQLDGREGFAEWTRSVRESKPVKIDPSKVLRYKVPRPKPGGANVHICLTLPGEGFKRKVEEREREFDRLDAEWSEATRRFCSAYNLSLFDVQPTFRQLMEREKMNAPPPKEDENKKFAAFFDLSDVRKRWNKERDRIERYLETQRERGGRPGK